MREPTSQVQVRIPASVHQALKDEAKRQDRSVNWLISKVLAAAMPRQEPQR